MIKCDVITLDNQLDNEYTDHLMQGKSLPINFSSFVHMTQAIGYTDQQVISLSRSFSRLKTVFTTFYKQVNVADYRYADDGGWGELRELTNIPASHLPFREFNFFYHPQFLFPGSSADVPDINGPVQENGYHTFCYRTEPELQLQVGAKLFPEIPMRSSPEMYYQLRKALGSHQLGSQYAANIYDQHYRSSMFIVAFDTERQTNAGFSGLSTRAGDLITKAKQLVHINQDGRRLANTEPTFLHTTLEYDAIMTITDAGVTVLE
jgi:hypothetical protein